MNRRNPPSTSSPYSLGGPLAVLGGVALLAACDSSEVHTGTSTSPGPMVVEWLAADGEGGTHFSPLTDISPDNVQDLEVAWTYRTGDVSEKGNGRAGTAFEATPIMVDGVLYVSTPYSRVIALDPETGRELWAFDPEIDQTDAHYSMVTNRGISTWSDPGSSSASLCHRQIFLASHDARLFALDGVTGEPCPDFGDCGVVDLRVGLPGLEGKENDLRQTAPSTVIGDLVVVGSAITDNLDADAPSGMVRAFDARTGELRWGWEPLIQVGGEGIDGEWIPAGAANTWATIVADEERDLLFVPTGSASPDHYGGLRPGDNRYANSLVALRGSTGEVVWHYQMVHHDLWDYDLPSPPALITVEREGKDVPAVVQSTKMGYLFVLHRETGEPLFPVVEQPVPASDIPGEWTSPTQPIPTLPPPLAPQGFTPDDAWGLTPIDRMLCRRIVQGLRSGGVYTPPSLEGSVVNPGFMGGMEWGGVAHDPGTGLIVTNTNRVTMVATLIPREDYSEAEANVDSKSMVGAQRRTPYGTKRSALLSPLNIPCNPPPWGMLHAVDAQTGEIKWEVPLGMLQDLVKVPTPRGWGSPNLGGAIITGGLVFIGATMDRRFRAFDLQTGDMVWETKLPASAQAAPLTYRARPDGRQFVVIAAGGHSSLMSALGDYVVAFALPEDRPEEDR